MTGNWILPCSKNSVHSPVIFTIGLTWFTFPVIFSMGKNPVHFFPYFYHRDNSVHFSQQIYHVSPMVKMREKVNRVTKKNLKVYLTYDSSGGILKRGSWFWEFPAGDQWGFEGKFFPQTTAIITGGIFFRIFSPAAYAATLPFAASLRYAPHTTFGVKIFLRGMTSNAQTD
jgi:hypothetical protein